VLTLLFATQIFCDFEGYSSIARGLAYWLGYRFPLNFDNPYIATSFSNFWERWHITLSRWLRDYLYIPLGGNRESPSRTYMNLLTVMVLGGLWHGSAVTFVAWGTLHGLALAAERLLGFNQLGRRRHAFLLKILWYLVVQAVVMAAWVFFRSDTVAHSVTFLRNIAEFHFEMPRGYRMTCLYMLPAACMHLHGFLVEREILRPVGRLGKAVLAGLMLYAVLACYGESSEFIYFQF
jgi:alginate O-acetyltransferase complex protein AlgI